MIIDKRNHHRRSNRDLLKTDGVCVASQNTTQYTMLSQTGNMS